MFLKVLMFSKKCCRKTLGYKMPFMISVCCFPLLDSRTWCGMHCVMQCGAVRRDFFPFFPPPIWPGAGKIWPSEGIFRETHTQASGLVLDPSTPPRGGRSWLKKKPGDERWSGEVSTTRLCGALAFQTFLEPGKLEKVSMLVGRDSCALADRTFKTQRSLKRLLFKNPCQNVTWEHSCCFRRHMCCNTLLQTFFDARVSSCLA